MQIKDCKDCIDVLREILIFNFFFSYLATLFLILISPKEHFAFGFSNPLDGEILLKSPNILNSCCSFSCHHALILVSVWFVGSSGFSDICWICLTVRLSTGRGLSCHTASSHCPCRAYFCMCVSIHFISVYKHFHNCMCVYRILTNGAQNIFM